MIGDRRFLATMVVALTGLVIATLALLSGCADGPVGVRCKATRSDGACFMVCAYDHGIGVANYACPRPRVQLLDAGPVL